MNLSKAQDATLRRMQANPSDRNHKPLVAARLINLGLVKWNSAGWYELTDKAVAYLYP